MDGQIFSVEYLGRYTRKGMLHESRIADVTAEHVSFRYKDYRDGQQHKQMRLSCDEFIRRYLLHVLPKGLLRVRHFGFLANACRCKKLALIQQQLGKPQVVLVSPLVKEDCSWSCPQCLLGHLQFIGLIRPQSVVMINCQGQPVRMSG
uniref:Transposase, IS91 family, putative n=1 Tax=Shewanella putrefaciens (strain CN-32 / ATCC BAA-453) TaxID=319224 RepID=A4Y572_SHEPC